MGGRVETFGALEPFFGRAWDAVPILGRRLAELGSSSLCFDLCTGLLFPHPRARTQILSLSVLFHRISKDHRFQKRGQTIRRPEEFISTRCRGRAPPDATS